MSNACETSVEPSLDVFGGSEFLTRPDRSERCRQLADLGYLVARVAPVYDTEQIPSSSLPPSSALKRGHLRQALEGAVEISLALRGAQPPATVGEEEAELAAANQLTRLHQLNASGLCLVLPELRRVADDDGTLDIADSTALDVWRELAESEPVYLLLDDGDRDLNILAPRRLSRILGSADQDLALQGPLSWADDNRDDGDGAELSDCGDDDPEQLESEEDGVPASSAPSLAELCTPWTGANADTDEDRWSWYDPTEMAEATAADSTAETEDSHSGSVMRGDPLAGIEPLDSESEPPAYADDDLPLEDDSPHDESPAAEPNLDGPQSCEPCEDSQSTNEADLAAAQGSLFDVDRPTTAPVPSPPLKAVMPAEQCRQFSADLMAATGPKPVTMIEDLFRDRYVPMLEALSCGLDDLEAERAVAAWRSSFEKSYVEGFNAMRLTGKRPTMVLDAGDEATRIARQNGARTVQLMLIDSMRFDLGERVAATLRQRLAGHALCVDETLLWSALPTNTPTQLRLLSRGPRGLAETDPQSERDPIVQRGKSVTTLRRIRIGQRDLVKLDVVEARLREVGGGYEKRFEELSDEVSDIIVRFSESLEPRTLLYVFGDHGFQLPTEGRFQTGIASQGGASPEEVLLGGYGWLIDDLH